MDGRSDQETAPASDPGGSADGPAPSRESPRGDGASPVSDLREVGRPLVYLAAERTLLTWIRAAIGFVILGFAVDRFGLVLARRTDSELLSPPISSWVGIALILTGVAASVAAALRYRRFAVRYARGDVRPGSGLPLAIGLAVLLAAAGAGLACVVWLSIR